MILECVRTADNYLVAYEKYLKGVSKNLELLSYSHGETGKQQYVKDFETQKEIVKQINNTKEKQDIGSKEEMEKLINEFLNNTSKKSLYMLIDNIEIDENKNVFINFAFSKLNETVKYINEEVEVKDLLKQA